MFRLLSNSCHNRRTVLWYRHMKKLFSALFCVCLWSITGIAGFADALSARSTAERLMQPYYQEISRASSRQVPPSEVGEWYDIIQTSLFMLVRKTEVFRGSMRVIITDTSDAFCMVYPDGTFLVTTGLLDYIDTSLFTAAESSPRKIRNFNRDRELCFAPIAAVCVARFALSKYVRNPSFETVVTCDVVAGVLLKSAGYTDNLLVAWLNRLETIQRKKTDTERFKRFLAAADPHERIDELYNNKDTASNLYEDISAVLFSLHNYNGMTDALQLLEHLKQIFPKSVYFHRLTALVMHQLLINEQSEQRTVLNTFFSADVYNGLFTRDFFDTRLREISTQERASRTVFLKSHHKLYAQTKHAYKQYFNIIYEAGLASSYAQLLARSPLQHEQDMVLKIADQADRFHTGGTDKTVRANYAVLLYMIGKDYQKARLLLEDCFLNDSDAGVKHGKIQTLFLHDGFPLDERQLLFHYIAVLRALNENDAAEQQTKRLILFLDPVVSGTAAQKPLIIRSVFIGAGIDDLLRTWKRPSSIVYNYYTERWMYRAFNCEVVIDVWEKQNTVAQLIIGYPSSLTLFGSMRTGDTREAFEAVCGKPVYRSADTYIYYCQGALLQVLYGNNKIRTITIRN